MSGPWDKYKGNPGSSGSGDGPWKRYRAPEPSTPPERKKKGWSGLGSAAQGALQGVTFGFADELEAFTKSMLTEEKYNDALRKTRQRYKDAQLDNPDAYTTGDVGASVVSSFIPGVGLAGNAVRGAGLAAKVGRGALAGSSAGALRGAGDGEGFLDSAGRAGIGAVTGGTLGSALPVAGAGLGAAGRGTNQVLNNVVQRGSNIVDNLSALPAVKGVRNSKMLGPLTDDAVDAGTDFLAAKGFNKPAEMIGDFYKDTVGGSSGLLARGAASTVFPGLVPTELAIRGGAYGAQAAGGIAKSPTVIAGISQGMNAEGPREQKPTYSDPADEELIARAQGTQWEASLADAQQRGPLAVRNALFVLKRRPEFRQALGLDE